MDALKQYWLLFRLQVKPALFGWHKASENKGRQIRTAILLLLSEVNVGIFLTLGYLSMAEARGPAGQLSFVPISAMAAGTGACLISTIFMTDGTLYEFEDCEILMALPLRTAVIAAVRLTIVYADNLLILLPIMVPAAIACGICAQPGWDFYALLAAGMLLTPLLPTTAGTLLGALAAPAAARSRKRSAV